MADNYNTRIGYFCMLGGAALALTGALAVPFASPLGIGLMAGGGILFTVGAHSQARGQNLSLFSSHSHAWCPPTLIAGLALLSAGIAFMVGSFGVSLPISIAFICVGAAMAIFSTVVLLTSNKHSCSM